MTFAHWLVRDYEIFSSDLHLIHLPVNYLCARAAGVFLWFFIGGLFSYNILYAAALFGWIYGGYCAYLLGRIWVLHRLSLFRYCLLIAVLFGVSLLTGTGIREFIIDLLTY